MYSVLPARFVSRVARMVGLTVLCGIAGPACLAFDSDCGSDRNQCELEPLLLTYLAIEDLSFRPMACGTYAPAKQAEENDAMLLALPSMGPVSFTGILEYDTGFLNQPLHLVGCTPARVTSSQSVNAGTATALTETYFYNSQNLVVYHAATTSSGTFVADVAYSPTEYATYIRGDCANLAGSSRIAMLSYDLLQRPVTLTQTRPENCQASSPAGLSVSASAFYSDYSRLTSAYKIDASATSAGIVTVDNNTANVTYTRDAAGRILTRNQDESQTRTTTPPGSIVTQSRSFTFTLTYDSLGRVTQFIGSRGTNTNATINYTYDSGNRVTGITTNGQKSGTAANSTDTYTYDSQGRIISHTSNYTLGATNTVTNYTYSY